MSNNNASHYERCKLLKIKFKELLEALYGKVEINYKFDNMPSKLSGFKGFKYYNELENIYSMLLERTKGNDFIKIDTLHNCDFYIPSIKTIVEFDESQHFTIAREKTLELYPDNIKLGFDKDKWIDLCKAILAEMHKEKTPYRDEQRAWYDTLRDFAPEYIGLNPTIRIYSQDFPWCSFSKSNKEDLERFESLIIDKYFAK